VLAHSACSGLQGGSQRHAAGGLAAHSALKPAYSGLQAML